LVFRATTFLLLCIVCSRSRRHGSAVVVAAVVILWSYPARSRLCEGMWSAVVHANVSFFAATGRRGQCQQICLLVKLIPLRKWLLVVLLQLCHSLGQIVCCLVLLDDGGVVVWLPLPFVSYYVAHIVGSGWILRLHAFLSGRGGLVLETALCLEARRRSG
jgi:hypothetical protein